MYNYIIQPISYWLIVFSLPSQILFRYYSSIFIQWKKTYFDLNLRTTCFINKITSNGWFILSNMLFWNRNLQELTLCYNSIGDEGLKHLPQINSLLNILSNDINNFGLKYFSQRLLHHQVVIVLGLVSDRGVEILSQSILHFPKKTLITDGLIYCFNSFDR